MSDYRLYCLDEANRITRADVIHAECDEQAIRAARAMKQPADCELWLRDRLVAAIPAWRGELAG